MHWLFLSALLSVNFMLNICSAQVFEGHPFIVEAGVSVGGKDVKQVFPFSSNLY